MFNHKIDNGIRIQVLFYIFTTLKVFQVLFITKINKFQFNNQVQLGKIQNLLFFLLYV